MNKTPTRRAVLAGAAAIPIVAAASGAGASAPAVDRSAWDAALAAFERAYLDQPEAVAPVLSNPKHRRKSYAEKVKLLDRGWFDSRWGKSDRIKDARRALMAVPAPDGDALSLKVAIAEHHRDLGAAEKIAADMTRLLGRG